MEATAVLGLTCNVLELLKACKGLYGSYQEFRQGRHELASISRSTTSLDATIFALQTSIKGGDIYIQPEDQDLFDLACECAESASTLRFYLQGVLERYGEQLSRREALAATFKYFFQKGNVERQILAIESKQDHLQTALLVHLKCVVQAGPGLKRFGGLGIYLDCQFGQLDVALRNVQDCLGAIKYHNAGLIARETEGALQRKYDDLLKSLFFPEIYQRNEQIADAHEKTLKWVFRYDERYEWEFLPAWLQSDQKLYWISGKAGSGKSTLMRWLYENEETTRLLREFNTSKRVVMISHFFFLPGAISQKSILGFLKSLFYRALEKCPDLARKSGINFLTDQIPVWTVKSTLSALLDFFRSAGHDCLFVLSLDGLDECHDDHSELLQSLSSIQDAGNVKIIASSRPLAVFGKYFEQAASLRVQDLTRSDIEAYVSQRLLGATGERSSFSCLPQDEISRLIRTSVAKSDGVFLWTKVAMDSLCRGISNGDPVELLHQRLHEIPTALSDMFAHMLSQVEPIYRETAERYCKLRIQALGQLLVLELAICDAEGLAAEDGGHIDNRGRKDLEAQCSSIAQRLPFICNGILELKPFKSTLPLKLEFGKDTDYNSWKRVEFFHRSAYDYMKDRLYNNDSIPDQGAADESIDQALVYSSITLLRFVDDPLIYCYLTSLTLGVDGFEAYFLDFLPMRYLKKHSELGDVTFTQRRKNFVNILRRSINGALLEKGIIIPDARSAQDSLLTASQTTLQPYSKLDHEPELRLVTTGTERMEPDVHKVYHPLAIEDILDTVAPETIIRLLSSTVYAFMRFMNPETLDRIYMGIYYEAETSW